MAEPPAQTDRDLDSIREARTLARQAKAAQALLADLTQEQVDRIVDAMASAAAAEAAAFARLAVEDTGFGVEADKVRKNLFAAETIHRFIKPMRTVGVIARHEDTRVVDIAEPFGVVAAVIPSTNPTSTAIYKILVCLKARCAVVLSPHPSAVRSIRRVAEVMTAAATAAGAPAGAISCMQVVTLEGTQELMRRREVALILATGGLALVRAAYSAGKPAYGVGPGNAPAYIERTADLPKAVADIITGKTFDNGVLCSSENSVVVDEAISGEARHEFTRQGGHFLRPDEAARLAAVLVTSDRLPNPALVGRTALEIANLVGIDVPPDTRVLIAPLDGVGRDYPLSMEKLCPVLSFYVVSDWREGCTRCQEILRYGGMGHTMSIHSQDERVILEFGLKKSAFRIVVNTPTTLGSIGMTTGLSPSMTLGCGGHGGNITSDNITPLHLLNTKRLAYELRPAKTLGEAAGAATQPRLPEAPARPARSGMDPALLTRRIDAFLATRGISAAPGASPVPTPAPDQAPRRSDEPHAAVVTSTPDAPVDFVCEDDVRQALREKRRIAVGERTIITPSARDLAQQHRVFVPADVPR
ncbi:MAG: aldehyde dehydrogenase family protein [Acidobacteria bacterium]|nr:aldehyde dehydrogenase family protein [Acidobacteriota bacterium]